QYESLLKKANLKGGNRGGFAALIGLLYFRLPDVQAHLMSHQYESLLKKANLKGGNRGGFAALIGLLYFRLPDV
ncbi:hypothetical protein C7E18_24065, partial [Stenotrophomonas maltophilia]